MKVFSREKFIKKYGESEYKRNKGWVDECEGMPVRDGKCGLYGVYDFLCIEVPDQKKEEKKVYTMKDFREKKIAVRVGTKHVKEFLQMCEAEGLRWADGERATEVIPDESAYGCETVITMNATSTVGRLTYGSAPVLAKYDGMTIVDFDDFEKQPEPARYKITIECDGTTTTARMEVNGKEVKQAQAKRNPDDKFSWRVGAETAFGRLWDNGEKWVYLDGETCATHSSEYVVLEGYKPDKAGKEEKKEPPFKVGDRVVCVKATDDNELTVGKHGRIIRIGTMTVCVEFDENINGHDGVGRGKWGYCWGCYKETLRHE